MQKADSMKRFIKPLIVVAVVAFAVAGIHNIVTTKERVQLQEVQLKSKTSDLKELQLQYDSLNIKLDTADRENEEQIKQLETEKQQLEQRQKELEQQVSAKREAERLAAEKVQRTAQLSATASAVGSTPDCEAWFAAAGITGSELTYARILMRKENAGCDPQLYNRGGSDACGVAQELPCGKSGCGMPPNADGACQVAWQVRYVKARYGSYANAVSFHQANNWY